MTHFYERNIVEIKTEYTSFLTNIMSPLIHEGIRKIYDKACETEKQFKEAIKDNPNMELKNPGVLRIFQEFLLGIKNLNNYKIEAETNRIREASKCSDWFDDLVKGVIKSYIVLLTYNASEKRCRLVDEKFHNLIDIKTFVHKCYVETARMFYNYPELFWHGFSTVEIKRNQREAYELIKISIIEAIRKMLPMKLILEEYLKNDYIHDDNEISEHMPQSRYHNMRSIVKRDMEFDNINRILESETDNTNSDNIDNIDTDNTATGSGETVKMVDIVDIANQQNGSQMDHAEPMEGSGHNSYESDNGTNHTDDTNNGSVINGENLGLKQEQIIVENNNNYNEGHSVFQKKESTMTNQPMVGGKGDTTDRQLRDLDDKYEISEKKNYLKSPVAIKGGKNNLFKEQVQIYKNKMLQEKLGKDDEIEIAIKKLSSKSDKNKFYDKMMSK